MDILTFGGGSDKVNGLAGFLRFTGTASSPGILLKTTNDDRCLTIQYTVSGLNLSRGLNAESIQVSYLGIPVGGNT